MGLYRLLRRQLYIFITKCYSYPTENAYMASTACYRDSFSFLYVEYSYLTENTRMGLTKIDLHYLYFTFAIQRLDPSSV
jgi:hypothetical protein